MSEAFLCDSCKKLFKGDPAGFAGKFSPTTRMDLCLDCYNKVLKLIRNNREDN